MSVMNHSKSAEEIFNCEDERLNKRKELDLNQTIRENKKEI